MANEIIAAATGTGTGKFRVTNAQGPVTLSATGLATTETVDIQISQDGGSTFANTGTQLDATTNTKLVEGPGLYQASKSTTAASVGVFMHTDANL